MMENWNYCAEQIRAPWIALLSGDDLASRDYVAAFQGKIDQHPEAVLVRGDWQVIDEQGKVIRDQRLLSVRPVAIPPASIREQLLGPKVCIAAFAIKAQAWRDIGRFDLRMKGFGDWALWLAVAQAGAIVHAPKIVSGYRETPRPALDLKRLPERIHDEHYIFLEIYLSIQKRWGLTAEIRSAKRARLVDLLRYVASFPKGSLGAADFTRLQEMAQSAGMDDTYEKWLRFPESLSPSRWDVLRKKARNCARSLVKRIRRG